MIIRKISSNSLLSPAGRTLTRTQDFMVVPSEVVYGPGGEKINKGIAYTALDGRMSSSFKIPVSSSYQEEVEARRLKRERAMIRSKMMRPDIEKSVQSTGGSSGGVNSAKIGRTKTDSVRGLNKLKEGNSNGTLKSLSNSLSNSANISGKRSEKIREKDVEQRSKSSSLTGSNGVSPQSSSRSILVSSTTGVGFSSSLIKVSSLEQSGLRSSSRDKVGTGSISRQSFRRESTNSIGSFDSVRFPFRSKYF